MFEIPDDDDNFWEDLPLDDITDRRTAAKDGNASGCMKRLSSESDHQSSNKRLRPGLIRSPDDKDFQRGAYRHASTILQEKQIQNTNCQQEIRQDSRTSETDQTQARVPAVSQHIVVTENQEPASHFTRQSKTRQHEEGHLKTPVRIMRKFPGPAGLLPRISPGSIKDNQQLQKQTVSTSPEILNQQDESVILSSQSGEEVFNEVAWQTLLNDLGEDGRKQMVKFSIATSFQKARKKLLPKGKVPLVIAVIEGVDWQGSDASICLKDKSGKIHGTVHQSLMKEHQCDLQPGNVVVLRQVSMISPTTRNHYLNVTPANVVVIYSNTSNGLKTIRNIEKNTSLNSVLQQVEPYISEDGNVRRRSGINMPKTPSSSTVQGNMSTPGSVPNNSRQRNLSTPGSAPNNPRQGNMSTPGSFPNNHRQGNISTPGSAPNNYGQGNISTPGSVPNDQRQGNMSTPGSMPNNHRQGNMSTPGSVPINHRQGNMSTPGSLPNNHTPGSISNNSRNISNSTNFIRSDQTGSSMCVTTPQITNYPTVHTPTNQQNSSNQTPQRPQSSNKFKFVKTPNILNTGCNSVQSAGSHTAPNNTGSRTNLSNSQLLPNLTVSNNVNQTSSVYSRVPNTPVTINENKQNFNQASSSISLTQDERKMSEKPYFSRNLCSTDFNSNKIEDDNTSLGVRNTISSNNLQRSVPNVPSKSGNSERQASNRETTECSASSSVKNSFRFKSSNRTKVTAGVCKNKDINITAVSTASTTKNVLKHVRDPPRPCFEVDSLWQDDLSDDLLSQLSDEMM
ncbi:homeobox-like protein HDP1 isoform X2 [Mytilus trossulus]|uniref:homeobox-like protein HDP1 isoform X2 n=1 Tax=Mytilus trossulus TaxID=6551 RepID=UPI0030048702